MDFYTTIEPLVAAHHAFAPIQFFLSQFTIGGRDSILFVSGFGLVLGVRHSTDADHVVALSTIVSKQRSVKRAALIGMMWGIGHSVTIFVVGSLIILLNVQIPPRLGLSMEFSVAIMLIVLGLLNLTGLMQRLANYFVISDERFLRVVQQDISTRQPGPIRRSIERVGFYHFLRPLVVGLVHGLAGSAAVALLCLSTIRSPTWAIVYLLIFGLGTVVGMMLMTTAIAVPLTYSSKRFAILRDHLATTSGLVSLCFGSFLVYQLGFVGGLFSRHPQWVPR